MPPIIGPHEAAWVWISGWMGNLNLAPENTPCTDADVKSSFVDHLGHRGYTKLDTVCTAGKAWTHVTRLYGIVSELRDENKGLSERVMEAERKVIQLQEQLIESKDNQMKGLTSTVETVVRDSVEKSYCQVAATNVSTPAPPAITPAAIERAVRDMAESEERSKNVLIFGLDEQDSESIEERVAEIFEAVNEKPRPDTVTRVGKKTTDNNRPVIVKFSSASIAMGILRKSQTLRSTEKFKKVFVSPDRSILQRNKHRQLVTELKRRAGEDKGRRYYIRDGQIQSEERGVPEGD